MAEDLWKCTLCGSVVGTATGRPPKQCNVCRGRDWQRHIDHATQSTSIEDVLPDTVKRDIDEERDK
jgi:hypothetical protein